MITVLVFLVGFVSGAVVGFLRFRSKLKHYKHIINHRLSIVTQQLVGSHSGSMPRTPKQAA